MLVAALGIALQRVPASAASVPPAHGLLLVGPLPSIELPLPSIGLASALPSISLPTLPASPPLPTPSLPLPSVSLRLPTPSLVVSSLPVGPTPTGPAVSSTATHPGAAARSQAASAQSSATPSRRSRLEGGSSPGSTVGDVVGSPTPDVNGGPSRGPSDGRLQPEWIVPSLIFGVPVLIAIVAVLAQLVGGATIVRVARQRLSRLPGPMPHWMRGASDAPDGG
jgi:hypothetical protein